MYVVSLWRRVSGVCLSIAVLLPIVAITILAHLGILT